MTQAIIEILGMLIIAAGIGVYFTYRHWKLKFNNQSKENEQLKNDLHNSNAQITKLEKDQEILKTNYQSEINDLKKKQKEKQEKDKSEIKDLNNQLEKEQKNSKKIQKSNKQLEHSLELKDEQLGEKERELAEVSKHFTTYNISYYKQIDGKRYKAATLAEADESVAGAGDGRISKDDAERVFTTISDGHVYTQVEKDTMHYIREHYNWTPEADELFRKKVRSWAAKGHQLDES